MQKPMAPRRPPLKTDGSVDNIFGYTFEEIQAAQQGAPLGRKIDASKPVDDAGHHETDLKLLEQYGETTLRKMGYLGVIDRLARGGYLNPREMPGDKPTIAGAG